MSDVARSVLGRRKLLVLGAGAAAIPACGGSISVDGSSVDRSSGDASSGNASSGASGSSSGGSGAQGASGSSGSTRSGEGGASGGSFDGGSSGSGSSGGSVGGSSGRTYDGGRSSGGSSSGGATSGNVLTLSFSQYPSLRNAGGSVVVAASGYSDPNCHSNQIVVVCTAPGKYVALSTSCTDQCCAISFVSTMAGFRCPCHGATFDITGRSTSFLASLPLPSLAVSADSSGVYVTLA